MNLRRIFLRSNSSGSYTHKIVDHTKIASGPDLVKLSRKKTKHTVSGKDKVKLKVKTETRSSIVLGHHQVKIADWQILIPTAQPVPELLEEPAPQTKKVHKASVKKPAQPRGLFGTSGLFVTQKRSYSTHAWSYPSTTLRLAEYLKDEQLVLPQGNFTTIQHALRGLKELREIFAGIGASSYYQQPYRMPRDIVVFNPERMALQYTGIVTATEIKSQDDAEFHHICRKLYKKIHPAVRSLQLDFIEMEQVCENISHDFLRKHKSSFDSTDPMVQRFLQVHQAVRTRLSGKSDTSTIDMITQKIFMDDLLREQYQAKVYDVVVQEVTQEVGLQHLTALDQVSAEERDQILMLRQHPSHQRLTKIIAGGIATGKSSIAKIMAAEFKAIYGREISDFAVINTDRFRPLLTDDPSLGDDPVLRSTLAHDEARLMTDMAIDLIGKKVEELGHGPDVFMEAVSPTNEELHISTKNQGRVRIAWTLYPPEKAVEGNYKRFQDKQERLPPVSAVLGSQQLGSKDAPKIMNDHSGKDIVMTLHNTYKIIHESAEGSALIAILHCQKEKVVVLDVHGILDFVKKSHINTKATSPDSVYPEPEKISLQANIANFLSDYGHKEIVFIDPTAKLTDINEFEEHTYAVYTHERGLEIKDKTIFDKIVNEDAVSRELFTALGAKFDLTEESRSGNFKKL